MAYLPGFQLDGGVQAFLVLSSFFLTKKLYSKEDICFERELMHRIKRLYPAYIFLIIGAAWLIFLVTGTLPYDIPVFFLSMQNFFWVLFGWDTPLSSIIGHTWYITLDVYLFILWVLILKVTPKSKWTVASYTGIVFSIIWRVVCNLVFEDNTIAYTIPFGQMDSFCLGSLLAMNMINGKTANKYAIRDISLGILGILACFVLAGYSANLGVIETYHYFANSGNYTGDPILVNIYFFAGLLSVGLLRLCLSVKSGGILSKPWMVSLGNWSYELYLFHYPIIWGLEKFIGKGLLLIVLALPITIFSAYLWHKFAEERIVKLIGE